MCFYQKSDDINTLSSLFRSNAVGWGLVSWFRSIESIVIGWRHLRLDGECHKKLYLGSEYTGTAAKDYHSASSGTLTSLLLAQH